MTPNKTLPLIILAIGSLLCLTSAMAQKIPDTINVASCPDQPKLPVAFQIDCSHISIFYLKLFPQMEMTPSQAEREARFSRMLLTVAGGKPEVRQFLIENGCSKF